MLYAARPPPRRPATVTNGMLLGASARGGPRSHQSQRARGPDSYLRSPGRGGRPPVAAGASTGGGTLSEPERLGGAARLPVAAAAIEPAVNGGCHWQRPRIGAAAVDGPARAAGHRAL